MSMGCFLMGVTGPGFTPEGNALLGSVSDNPYNIRTFLKAVRPAGSLGHLGTGLVSTTEASSADPGYVAGTGDTWRGINEKGLAFTCAMIVEDESLPKKPEVTPFSEVTKKMLGGCLTVADAIRLFQKVGATHPAFSVLLADEEGYLAHLEVGSFGINVNYQFSKQNPGAVVAVNCYLSKKLAQYNAIHAAIGDLENNNKIRRDRGLTFIDKLRGKLGPDALARLLSDHTNGERDPRGNPIWEAWGYSICNHGTRREDNKTHKSLPWGSVSGEILQPSERVFWYAYGWPCGQKPEYGDQILQENSWGKFVPFSLEIDPDEKDEMIFLSTKEGEVTPEGLKYQVRGLSEFVGR